VAQTMVHRPLRAAFYGRVSTTNHKQDVGLQARELRQFAEARGWQIFGEYLDEGISGSKDSRPELNRLMNDAHKRRFDVVCVWRFDRFARSVSHLLRALETFRALGIDFVSFSEQMDTSTPAGKMVFTVLGAVAELERSLIIERVRAGMRNAKAKGKFTATEALQRCIQLHPRLQGFQKPLMLLAEFRNSAIHLGEIIRDERKEIFHAFLAATSLLVDELVIKRETYFGKFADLVATHLDDSLAEANRDVAEQLACSKNIYAQRYSALAKDQMDVVAKSVEASYPIEEYERVLTECPACGRRGLLIGSHEVEWEVDYDDDGSISGGYPVVTMTPAEFFCLFCDLTLAGAVELQAAGLPPTVDIEDPDPRDFYDPPDEY
jgi:DNA invertase Pin-like site-specific DNA recombinase